MELLQNPADRGYPAGYLLSRIRGRRSRLVRNWKPLIAALDAGGPSLSRQPDGTSKIMSPFEIQRRLTQEYHWVYGQMNGKLRARFQSFFAYAELKTLFFCLRRLTNKKAGFLDELLGGSLLSDSVKEVLLTSADQKSAVSGIERVFLSLSARFSGLVEALEGAGLRGVEQRIAETYLAWAAGAAPHPLLREFFSRIVDARNIMGLLKYLRWEQGKPPAVIRGGNISEARFREAAQRADPADVASIIHAAAGLRVDHRDTAAVELALYRGMTTWLKKAGRAPFGAAPILDYLWRLSIEAMNMSVLYHGKDLGHGAVAAELVLS